jgi:predicted dehydrogenase
MVSYWNDHQPDLVYKLAGEKEWTIVDCSAHPDRFSAEVAHFLDCVQTGSQPLVTVVDGYRASRVVDAAYRSAAKGKRITIPA